MSNNKNYIFVSNTETCKSFSFASKLEKYAIEKNIQIYILSAPLVDNKYISDYPNGLMIASPGYKIMFVALDNDIECEGFKNYIDDTLEDIGYSEKTETRILIEKFVEENPDAAALLLRNWLNEDWE